MRKLTLQSGVSIRKSLDTLMNAEAILPYVICWEKRIIYVNWIDAVPSFSVHINSTSLDGYTHLAWIKHIPEKVEKIH